jgi:hypothetical protein
LGAFYNALPVSKTKEKPDEPCCPDCGSALLHETELVPIVFLEKEGRRDLDEARIAFNRKKIFGNGAPGESTAGYIEITVAKSRRTRNAG